VLEQQAADDRSQRDADRRATGPDGDGSRLLVRREHRLDDREGGRHDQRRADAHADPGGDQRVDGRRECGRHGRAAEHHQSDREHESASEPVAEPAGEQQQPAERQGV
jgi:hypothetical protein